MVVGSLLQVVNCGDESFRVMTIGTALIALAMVKSFLTAEDVGA